MQVMEAAARSQPAQPPNADLVGLQFGLATANEFVRICKFGSNYSHHACSNCAKSA